MTRLKSLPEHALVDKGMSLETIQEANPLAEYDKDLSWGFITTQRFTEILYNDATR